MTLMSVRPKTMYNDSLNRGWMRGVSGGSYWPGAVISGTKEDFWQRELQHIGQQGIHAGEVDVSRVGRRVLRFSVIRIGMTNIGDLRVLLLVSSIRVRFISGILLGYLALNRR